MPHLRTDDGPRKLRAVWLGPKGAALPFEWTYVQWSVTLALLPVGMVAGSWLIASVAWVLTGAHAWWFSAPIGGIAGGYLAIWLAVWLMRNVTFDEPLRHKITVARDDLGRRTRRRAQQTTTWVMPWPTITDLPERKTP